MLLADASGSVALDDALNSQSPAAPTAILFMHEQSRGAWLGADGGNPRIPTLTGGSGAEWISRIPTLTKLSGRGTIAPSTQSAS